MGLWLILHKHFIAKPARATSSPRFVSDTIYGLADFQTEPHQMWPKYLPYGACCVRLRVCVRAIHAMCAVHAMRAACAVQAVLLVRSWVHAVKPSHSDGSHSHAPLHCQ